MNKISHNMNYSIEELRHILQTYEFNKMDNSYNNLLVYKIYDNENLPGEIFRIYDNPKRSTAVFREAFWDTEESRNVRIEVSNLGRVKINGQMKKQYQKQYGYLYVNVTPDISYEVYRLVAETWLDCPVEDTLEISGHLWYVVHHITDNGFDNRPSNLIWCTNDIHGTLRHKANESNSKINSEIIKRFDDILALEQHDINKKIIIDYLEDICALQISRKDDTDISKIEQIIDRFKIDKAQYPYINWDMDKNFIYKE